MPEDMNYKNEIANLNNEILLLKQQLQAQQLSSVNYAESMQLAQKTRLDKPTPKELNPILKQIRQKNLSMKEKQRIVEPNLYPSLPEDVYYQWIAPSRLNVNRDKTWYWTMGLLLMIMIVIAVIFREIIWIAVILAFFFALYVNSSIPASDTIYRLTRQGVEVGDGEGMEIYSWGQLLEYSYYFKNNTEILYIDTILAVPQRLMLLFSQEDRKKINMILESHLPYKIPPKKQGRLTRVFEGIYIPITDFLALQEKIDNYYDQKYAEIIHELKKQGRIPSEFSVDDLRSVEHMQTMQLIGEIQVQQDEEAKKILGL
jgi:hypothetical protein